jgi:hypothetical protein
MEVGRGSSTSYTKVADGMPRKLYYVSNSLCFLFIHILDFNGLSDKAILW